MRLAVPDLISNSYFPAVAAVELGFFKQEGLDVELELVFPVTRTMQLLREGELEFVAGAAHATLSAFPEWQGAKLLMALSQRMYWLLVLRADLNAKRGQVDAIRGLRIGAAPGPDDGLRRLLAEAGIDPARDVEIGPIPAATEPGVSFGIAAARALETGAIDGFWANAMGAEVAVRRGVGSIILDVRRGDGPQPALTYTFPALVATSDMIERDPKSVQAAIRAVVKTQRALHADPSLAATVGQKLFPETEAGLIVELIERDLPYYDPRITPQTVDDLNGFARDMSWLSRPARYEDVVATQFSHLWDAG